MKRILVSFLLFCAGMAAAEPDCSEPPDFTPSALLAYEPLESEARIETEASANAQDPSSELLTSPRPKLRPCKFQLIEIGREQNRKRGAVCSDWTILGETLKTIRGKYRGCEISSPVRVHTISDVHLSQLALMDCETAIKLKTWIEVIAKPAFADQGGGLIGLRLSGHYACRTKNNQPRARLSEHARGRAIDISAFVLKDGTYVSVLKGWKSETFTTTLKRLHGGACGVFSTVLGPEADRYHVDHFHFDTAFRRKGPLCR